MKKKKGVAWFMCVALSMVPPVFATEQVAPTPFVENSVATNDYEMHWANESIAKWLEQGIMQGYEDGTFRPDEAVTRAEFAKILVELLDYDDTMKAKDYNDVSARKWYADYVAKISSAQIMYETDGVHFYPEAPLTREEALYALANAYHLHTHNYERGQMANLETYMALPFSDKDHISEWALDAFKVFYEKGAIVSDANQNIRPQVPITRGELAVLLDRLTAEAVQEPEAVQKEAKQSPYFNEPNQVVQKATVKGTIYRSDETHGDIETYATLTIRNLTNGKIEEPIEIYDGVYSVTLIQYHDYQITAEHTINGQLYQDTQIISGLDEPTELDFHLKPIFAMALLEKDLYQDRWQF